MCYDRDLNTRWLEIDCRSETEPGAKIIEWWESCKEYRRVFAVLSQVSDCGVWTFVELPNGKRFTATALEETRLGGLRSMRPGNHRIRVSECGLHQGHFTNLEGFCGRNEARAYLENFFRIVDSDFCDERFRKATGPGLETWFTENNEHPCSSEPRDIYERRTPRLIDNNTWVQESVVIEAAVKFQQARSGLFPDSVFFEHTSIRHSFELEYWETRCNDEYIRDFLPDADLVTIRRFQEKNSVECWTLPSAPFSSSTLVRENELSTFDSLNADHPYAPGIFRCSRVGFNEQRNQAILELQSHVDTRSLKATNINICTEPIQSLFLLNLVGDSWRVKSVYSREHLIADCLVRLPRVGGLSLSAHAHHGSLPIKSRTHDWRLCELEGYNPDISEADTERLAEGEFILGAYTNPRGEPLTIIFSNIGIRYQGRWRSCFIPYRAMETFETRGDANSLRLRLYDGRFLDLVMTGFKTSPNHAHPIPDASWFSWSLQKTIQSEFCSSAFQWYRSDTTRGGYYCHIAVQRLEP